MTRSAGLNFGSSSKTKEEKKFPCSWGTNFILETLLDRSRITSPVAAFNLQTLLRNVMADDQHRSDQQVLDELKREIGYILDLLIPTFSTLGGAGIKPIVMFYAFDYYKLLGSSSFTFRSLSGQRARTQDLISKVLRTNSKQVLGVHGTQLNEVMNSSGVGVHSLLSVGGDAPSTTLYNSIHKLCGQGRVNLISHQPIDWHVGQLCSEFNLINSFTGSITNAPGLATKVFGDKYDKLPFYKSTHALLGDKPLMAPILNSPKKKMELVQHSITENWKHKTSGYVSDRVKSLYGVSIRR